MNNNKKNELAYHYKELHKKRGSTSWLATGQRNGQERRRMGGKNTIFNINLKIDKLL